MAQEETFTPRDHATGKRLRFLRKDVQVLTGDLRRRGGGVKATVRIEGRDYQVIGASCGIPRCMCDARLKPMAPRKGR